MGDSKEKFMQFFALSTVSVIIATLHQAIKNPHKSKFIQRLFLGLAITIMCLFSCNGDVQKDLVIFDFESEAELDQLQWNCHSLYLLTSEHVTHGTRALKLELYPYSLEYLCFSPILKMHDWSRYKTLRFDIFNPGNRTVNIGVRIDDRDDYPDYPDRYNAEVDLHPGINSITIPLELLTTSRTLRNMNLKNIRRFLIFTGYQKDKTTLYIDYIRLTQTDIDDAVTPQRSSI
jgi:hypothetical protein